MQFGRGTLIEGQGLWILAALSTLVVVGTVILGMVRPAVAELPSSTQPPPTESYPPPKRGCYYNVCGAVPSDVSAAWCVSVACKRLLLFESTPPPDPPRMPPTTKNTTQGACPCQVAAQCQEVLHLSPAARIFVHNSSLLSPAAVGATSPPHTILPLLACDLLQGVPNNYETDLIFPIVSKAAELAGLDYHTASPASQTALKVIGDHIRAVVYLMSDGVVPSNVGRGYVVRRLLRRVVMKVRHTITHHHTLSTHHHTLSTHHHTLSTHHHTLSTHYHTPSHTITHYHTHTITHHHTLSHTITHVCVCVCVCVFAAG
jgi:hypothetical protein